MEAGRSKRGVEAEQKTNEEEMSDTTLPQVEVKIFNKTLLIKVQCMKQRGILPKLFTEVEKYDLGLLNSSVMAFGPTAVDITIVGQMGDGCRGQVKSLVEALYSVLQMAL
ncbi:transcription factor bHLH25-like [Silene latifolia]|uniref:transcription factor bHLH25-like n=1 Tax=Silene latifolia TaxID=37657 RepID=UPI003D786B7D